jgi:DNA-binding transcriptional ArsR family regulator
MKAVKMIKDPEAFQLLADDTRRRIIHLLRAKERTVSQIAEELGLTPQAIYHHIRKMKSADLVEVAREERIDHFIETYYRATAEVFHISHGEEGKKETGGKQTKETLANMAKIGINVPVDDTSVSKFMAATSSMKDCFEKSNWVDKITELEDVDFFTKQTMIEYSCLATMSDKEFEDFLQGYRDMRKVLHSSSEHHPAKKR